MPNPEISVTVRSDGSSWGDRLNCWSQGSDLTDLSDDVASDLPSQSTSQAQDVLLDPSEVRVMDLDDFDVSAWINDWLQRSSLHLAILAPGSLLLAYANRAFHEFCTTCDSDGNAVHAWINQLSATGHTLLSELYQRHVLSQIFDQACQIPIHEWISLQQTIVLAIGEVDSPEFRAVECSLRSDWLQVTPRDEQHADWLHELGWMQLSPSEQQAQLADPTAIATLAQQIPWDRYHIRGYLVLEGVEVTQRERFWQLTQLLMSHRAFSLSSDRHRISHLMSRILNAEQMLICGVFRDHLRPLHLLAGDTTDFAPIALNELAGSTIEQAIHTQSMQIVDDLTAEPQNLLNDHLAAQQGRSLLAIPLTHLTGESSPEQKAEQAIAGVVLLINTQTHQFQPQHLSIAQSLIPAFKTALSLSLQKLQQNRLIKNIHPSVEWRFMQEAERRSWGLPPERIEFKNVYPLYGISDIRGSSTERNHAIQLDLLEQFQLALNIVTSVCHQESGSFCHQLQLDIRQQIDDLKQGITVDTEVAAQHYLYEHIERYFDYFSTYNDQAAAAVHAYHQACNNEERSFYQARAAYDDAICDINETLRTVWDQHQLRMQAISPHYCDSEATDGIDHMIYAGQAIDPDFSHFHLNSLRYEQMLALCDCARTAVKLNQAGNPLQVAHLVLVQNRQVDIFHDEKTERLFDVQGTKDTRYEIVKKRIDKGIDQRTRQRITQPGMLTIVYSSEDEWAEYQHYLRYLQREKWVDVHLETGIVAPLQGVTGLRFARVQVLPEENESP